MRKSASDVERGGAVVEGWLVDVGVGVNERANHVGATVATRLKQPGHTFACRDLVDVGVGCCQRAHDVGVTFKRCCEHGGEVGVGRGLVDLGVGVHLCIVSIKTM